MQKHLRFVACAALAATLALPVQAQDDKADPKTVVATVNGVEITLGHMIVARASLPQQYQELPDNVLFDGILEQLIQQTALAQSFDGDLPARAELSLENERRSLTAGEVVEATLKDVVTDAALQAAYEARFADVPPGTEYNASHILVETEEEAKAIKEALDGGANFAELAREKSTGPSGPNGGALGWFKTGSMVPAFEAAVVALKAGEVSDPVQTQFGWHVILLSETRSAEIPPLDDVRGELENNLRQSAVEAKIIELTEAATVTRIADGQIDPALLKNLDLLD